jgi:hypothetical protein
VNSAPAPVIEFCITNSRLESFLPDIIIEF